MPKSRREFMTLLLAISSLVPLRRAGTARAAPVGGDHGRAGGWAASLFGYPDSARAVGAAYLSRSPDQADAGALLLEVFPGAARGGDSCPPSGREWREEFDRRRRSDFERGRVVRVGGWVLSETEAKLCALAALS